MNEMCLEHKKRNGYSHLTQSGQERWHKGDFELNESWNCLTGRRRGETYQLNKITLGNCQQSITT